MKYPTITCKSAGNVILTRGGLSGRIYAVTKWKELGNGNIEAVEKYDVTEQFNHLAGMND